MMKVYAVAAKRTAIGSMLGSLKDVAPADYAAEVVKQLLKDTGLNGQDIDEVIVGNVLPASLGQGVGRQVALKAGIPETVPAYSLNMVCGSGMKSVMNAYTSILAGTADIIIAGGTESMTRAPVLIPSTVRSGHKMGNMTVVDHMIHDSLTDACSGAHMGITAENIAEKYNITREMQDDFAIASQQKAIRAVDSGVFDSEIVPITIKSKKGETVFSRDEYPNRTTSREKLGTLRPAFKQGGTVTAGNASGINDGASFVMLASEAAVKKHNLKPLAEIIGVGQGGVDPQYMGLGPVPAIEKALNNADIKLGDVEILELNEAFAAQSLGVVELLCREHGVDRDELLEKTNVNGGAIALGHPVGASGNRILVTLIHEMINLDRKIGLASLCIGGGMGTAVVVKKA
ncbi:MAG: acetyl-CoA C-acetyltransferase [Clostridia bacterium]|nr:acetyl-CoA C-acetyltransferase [Clostridia bacterium]